MADPPEADSGKRVRKGITRRLFRSVLVLAALGIILGWLSTGFYKLRLGEEAVILRFGNHERTETREGWNWHWPEPLEYDRPVNTQEQRTHLFGVDQSDSASADQGIFVQTADKNIVSLSFELQYTIDDPYQFEYGMVQPDLILFESAQAAVRQVIGGLTIDEVLIKRKLEVETLAQNLLEETMKEYFASAGGKQPFVIEKINLQEVNPPARVLAAFAEVAAAQQDEERFVNAAKGERAEIIEGARAKSVELRESSEAYKEVRVLEAKGESVRFVAILAEYVRAPGVTRQRLYLETMEEILPGIDKVVVEPGTAQVMPILPSPGMLWPQQRNPASPLADSAGRAAGGKAEVEASGAR